MITLSLAIDNNSLSGLARSELGIYAGLGSMSCDELQTNGHTVTLTEDSDLFDVTVVSTETPQTISVCVVKPSGLSQSESISVVYDETPPVGQCIQMHGLYIQRRRRL